MKVRFFVALSEISLNFPIKPSGQERTAAEWNYVAEATRRRRLMRLFFLWQDFVCDIMEKKQKTEFGKNALRKSCRDEAKRHEL